MSRVTKEGHDVMMWDFCLLGSGVYLVRWFRGVPIRDVGIEMAGVWGEISCYIIDENNALHIE